MGHVPFGIAGSSKRPSSMRPILEKGYDWPSRCRRSNAGSGLWNFQVWVCAIGERISFIVIFLSDEGNRGGRAMYTCRNDNVSKDLKPERSTSGANVLFQPSRYKDLRFGARSKKGLGKRGDGVRLRSSK